MNFWEYLSKQKSNDAVIIWYLLAIIIIGVFSSIGLTTYEIVKVLHS